MFTADKNNIEDGSEVMFFESDRVLQKGGGQHGLTCQMWLKSCNITCLRHDTYDSLETLDLCPFHVKDGATPIICCTRITYKGFTI